MESPPSYEVLARKYRPQNFAEVIGQDAVTRTLSNAIEMKRIHHAYLFTGIRGVGKTSLARIFAKSLNCEEGPTKNPCQQCPACHDITASRSLDVLEIDGASNTGVDDVRELKESVRYAPTQGKYKIYIIDEVHMLSTSAFNALLKTLEEPPPHVIFIFATTEAHKIPATIVSRCQRFDFKSIPENKLIEVLEGLAHREGAQIAREAAQIIARAAEGSLRDAESLLDQMLGFFGKEVSAEGVSQALGLVSRHGLIELARAILTQDLHRALNLFQEMKNRGIEPAVLSSQLLDLWRDLILISAAQNSRESGTIYDHEILRQLIQNQSTEDLILKFEIAFHTHKQILSSSFPMTLFEVGLVKLVSAARVVNIERWLEKTQKDESLPNLTTVSQAPATAVPISRPSPKNPESAKPSDLIDAPHPSAINLPHLAWEDFVFWLKEKKPSWASLIHHAKPLQFGPNKLKIGFEKGSVYADMMKDRLSEMQEVTKKHPQFSALPQIELVVGGTELKDILSLDEIEKRREREAQLALQQKVEAHPQVQQVKNFFKTDFVEIQEIKNEGK